MRRSTGRTLCGWCLTGDHDRHRPGAEASRAGKAWCCACERCEKEETDR